MACCKFTATVPSMRVNVTPWLWDCVASAYVRGDDFVAHIRAPETNAETEGRQVLYMWYAASELQLRDPCDSACCRMDGVSFVMDGRLRHYYVQQVEPRFLGYPNYHHQAVLIRACPCGSPGSPPPPPDHPPPPPPPDHPPPPPPLTVAVCETSTVAVDDSSPSTGDTVTITVTARNWLGAVIPGISVYVYYTAGGPATQDGMSPSGSQTTDGAGQASWTFTRAAVETDVVRVVLNSGTADQLDCPGLLIAWGSGSGCVGTIDPANCTLVCVPNPATSGFIPGAATVTLTIRDAANVPIVGCSASVLWVLGSSSIVVEPISGFGNSIGALQDSDSSGEITWTCYNPGNETGHFEAWHDGYPGSGGTSLGIVSDDVDWVP